ncbi:MAG: glycerophosphoryl diester phosphodiesterase [Alphaproteobacteria bacterium]|nr:glycerophosphoryl diester phosphodiesterase [Alphaproteobacteria bacterium]
MTVPGVIGHRGAAAIAPENTLAGFRAAAEAGATLVELDAKLTADGQVICFHDADLARTTNASGSVKENDWESIRTLDAGGWFSDAFAGERVPLLSEALTLLKALGLGVNVEIKPNRDQAEETTVSSIAIIREHWDLSKDGTLFLSSFWRASLETAQDVAPEIPRAYLAHKFDEPVLDYAAALNCAGFNPNGNAVPEELVREAAERGFVISSYTINEPAKALELRAWGVDGIITDDPALMIGAGL